jgi:Skp family chaperone for outer membrane proteins
MKHTISDNDLRKAYIQAATIVAKYGDKYLPLFKRLEAEFNKRKEETEAMNRALDIAFSSYNPD